MYKKIWKSLQILTKLTCISYCWQSWWSGQAEDTVRGVVSRMLQCYCVTVFLCQFSTHTGTQLKLKDFKWSNIVKLVYHTQNWISPSHVRECVKNEKSFLWIKSVFFFVYLDDRLSKIIWSRETFYCINLEDHCKQGVQESGIERKLHKYSAALRWLVLNNWF